MTTISFDSFLKEAGAKPKDVKVVESTSKITPSSSVASRVISSIKQSGTQALEQITGTGASSQTSAPTRGFQLAATATGLPVKAVISALPESVQSGIGKIGEVISTPIKWLGDKIGSNQAVIDYVNKNPQAVKVIEELAQIGQATSETGGNIAAIQGGITTGKNLVEKTGKISKDVGAKLETIGNKIKTSTGEVINNTPESIMQRVARISKDKQAKFEQVAGESIGSYLTKRNIFGNIEDITSKLYSRFKNSYQQADDSLATLKGNFSPKPIRTMLDDLLSREQRISTPDAPSPILNTVQSLANKNAWNMSEINAIKRLYERNIKVDYLKTVNPEGVAKATNLDSAVRNWQLSQAKNLGLKNLEVINKETQLSKNLMDALGKEYAGSAGNNAMSLTDWIMLSGGDPTAIGGFLVKKGFSSKSVQSAIAKTLSKNKTKIGEVKADLQPSQVKELPAPTSNVRSSITGKGVIKVAPKGRKIEIVNQ